MNIGIDIRCLLSPHRTGVGEFTFELLCEVFKTDRVNQYYLFCNSSSEPKEFFPKYDNVHILWTRYPNKLFSFSQAVFSCPKIDRMLAEHFGIEKLDHFFSPHLNFTSLSKGLKHTILIHDLTFELFPEFLTMKQKLWHKLTRPEEQCRSASLVLTPSENTKRDVTAYYEIAPERIKVLYPGISPKFLEKAERKIDLPEDYILFLGTIEPRKNISAVIKAFEIASPKLRKSFELVIAGAPGWKNENFNKEINNSSLKNKIRVLNFVPEEEKAALYKNAKLFVYPSFYEGFGFPVLEAMFAGVPVITSNRSSLFEVAENSAYYVDPYRPDQLASGMIEILNSDQLSTRMTTAGAEITKKFSWNSTAKHFLEQF